MADLEPLDPAARALVDAYRAHTDPSPAVKARLRAAVLREAAEPVPEVHPRARARWLVPAVLTALAAALVAAMSMRRATPEVADGSGAAAPWELSPRAPAAAEPRTPARAKSEAPPSSPAPPAAVPATSERRPPRALPERHAPKDTGLADEEGLSVEMGLIRPAQRALAEDRPADALAALSTYAARFPAGLLHEEYLALHAVALCQAGREREGRGEAGLFLRDHGASMLAGRVRTACRIDDGTAGRPDEAAAAPE